MELEYVSVFTDIVISTAAIITAVVAIKGINAWAKEHKGKAAFEVARNLAYATYSLRNALKQCRNGWYAAHEFPSNYRRENKQDPLAKAEAYLYLFNNRWERVMKAASEFETQALDAEVLWGKDSKRKTDRMIECVNRLRASIDAYIDNIASDNEDFRANKEFAESVRNDVEVRKESENELSMEINKVIGDIEVQIRSYLHRD